MDHINCRYVSEDGNIILGRIYRCYVGNNLNINSSEPQIITAAIGQHESFKFNRDLVGIMIYNKKTEYFPRGLERIFPNLMFIDVCYGFLKEITQADLKPFRKLVSLNLNHNNIEVLEDGLFDYNFNLKFIYIGNNKISHVSSNLFNNLRFLTSLQLNNNSCIHMSAFANRDDVLHIIRYIRIHCTNPNYYKNKNKFKNLKQHQTSNHISEEYSRINKQLKNFTANLKKCKFLTFVLIKRKFEELDKN